jgi:hypothetical protein
MSAKLLLASLPSILLALGLTTTNGTAADPATHPDKKRTAHARTPPHRHVVRQAVPYGGYWSWGYGHRDYGSLGYGGWGYGHWGYGDMLAVSAYRHPAGYLYAPRRGIIDEACNLPTSACPNEMRDVNY